jgi:hypothetical protein
MLDHVPVERIGGELTVARRHGERRSWNEPQQKAFPAAV